MSINQAVVRPKAPADYFAIGMDFRKRLSAISSATATVEDLAGVDTDPSALLNGAPQISGTMVYQRVNPGVLGANYRIRIFAEGITQSGFGEGYEYSIILGVMD
jgi:hypothetical protein